MVAEIKELEVIETRKLASFRTVDSIEPIEGADAIELAVVGGWKVVTKKGEFKPGDPAVYFEIDSFLRDGVAAWQFLVDKQSREQNGVRGHRLRTIKLRGQISQGLILPVSAFPILELVLKETLSAEDERLLEVSDPALVAEVKNLRFGLHEHEAQLDPRDLNLNAVLGVTKWDPPLPAQLAGTAAGLFPSFIQKTDQERAQNLKAEIFQYEEVMKAVELTYEQAEAGLAAGRLRIVDGVVYTVSPGKAQRNAQYEITMKMDGSSATFFNHSSRADVGVCSRNLELKVDDSNKDNSFVRMLFDSGLSWAMQKYGNIAIQGELMGPAIQGNREQLKDFRLYVFDIQLLDEGRKASPTERYDILIDMLNRGVNPNKIWHAPVLVSVDGGKLEFVDHLSELHRARTFSLEQLGLDTMEKLLAFAEGPSLVHPVREGLVYKRVGVAYDNFSFKTISNAFLAKEKD